MIAVIPTGPDWDAFAVRVPERAVETIPDLVARLEGRDMLSPVWRQASWDCGRCLPAGGSATSTAKFEAVNCGTVLVLEDRHDCLISNSHSGEDNLCGLTD